VEITTQPAGDALEVRVTGRLDAYWADHLAHALEEVVRAGADRVRLNMAGVVYMSSVGIRVLLRFYKQLQRINGWLVVSEPSDAVKTVLELAGLDVLLATATQPAAPAEGLTPHRDVRRFETATALFEVYEAAAGASLSCQVVGQPERLQSSDFTAEQSHRLTFPDGTIGIGLGAFGSDFTECQTRFGEFVAAGGAAAYLPTDGTNVPDCLVASGAFVAQLSVLYALVCDGGFAHLARFETRADKGPVPLSELAGAALEVAAADAVGIVLVAETAGLMGASLRRSPAASAATAAPFAYPAIRDWLSFSPERAYARSVALVVGVVARAADTVLAPLLRPIGQQSWPAAHFHAAAFSYRPLQKGYIEMQPTVSALFEGEVLQGVVHLLNDDRRISGAGESEFVRGACWVSPITSVVAQR
jgi:anti-anti-sigma factor